MKRRRFLRWGLFGAGTLAVAGMGLQLWPTTRRHRPSPGRALAVLDEREFAILAAAAARIVTAPSADPVAIAERVDDSLAMQPLEAQADFKKLLGTLESALVGLMLDGRPHPFTHLSPDDQDAALFAFRDSRILLRRTGYQALRKLCVAAHYSDEKSWADVGYPGPPEFILPKDYQVPQ